MTLTPLPIKGRGVRVYGFLDGNRRIFWGCFGGKIIYAYGLMCAESGLKYTIRVTA